MICIYCNGTKKRFSLEYQDHVHCDKCDGTGTEKQAEKPVDGIQSNNDDKRAVRPS
jgi:DnaJ-class molecular chaperone